MIESYLLNNVTTLTEAKSKMAEAGFTTTVFTSDVANITPETTAITPQGLVKRFLPACGNLDSGSGTATNTMQGAGGYYYSSTAFDSENAFSWHFKGDNTNLLTGVGTATIGRSVRLFKDDNRCNGKSLALAEIGDIICTHGKVYSPTTGDLPCGGQKAAMVAYLGSNNDAAGTGPYSESLNHGLAVALSQVANTSGDPGVGLLNWDNGVTAASAYKCPAPPNTSGWFMVSAFQIQRIFNGCGSSTSFISNSNNFDTHTTNSLPYANFLTYLSNCGETTNSNTYWFSTEYAGNQAYIYYFNNQRYSRAYKTDQYVVRPVLAF